MLIRGDVSDDSYVTKVAIHASKDGVEWLKVNEHDVQADEQLVFLANDDSTTTRVVSKRFERHFVL